MRAPIVCGKVTAMTYTAVERPRVGWIGAGRMGLQLALRLVDAGLDVAIWNRTKEKTAPAVERGATAVDRPADLADRDIVFTMVSASADLLEVVTGPDGLLSGTGDGPGLLVDSSTVSGEASAEVRKFAAKRGTDFLAAPVSGNPKVVASGQMTMAVSGCEETFEAARPVLELLGRGVSYVGPDEVARLVKICHNVFLGVVTQAMAEVTILAQKGGASRAGFLSFLNDSVLGSTFSRYKTPAMVNLDFTPTFTLPLLRKDFDLGLTAARILEVPMPLASSAANIVTAAIGAGYRYEDFAVLIEEQGRASGLVLESEDADVDDGLGGEWQG